MTPWIEAWRGAAILFPPACYSVKSMVLIAPTETD
jgi:hypothetical protein